MPVRVSEGTPRRAAPTRVQRTAPPESGIVVRQGMNNSVTYPTNGGEQVTALVVLKFASAEMANNFFNSQGSLAQKVYLKEGPNSRELKTHELDSVAVSPGMILHVDTRKDNG